MPSRGLIVGKFLPLHRGHQLLIETGLAYVDDLTIVIYTDPNDRWSAAKRAGWITALYPRIENIIVKENPALPWGIGQDTARAAPFYADQLDFLGHFNYIFSSEDYGIPFAKAMESSHILVDQARKLVPISGTKIRENVYDNRGYIHPDVYRSLIQKVVFVGTESTGKSTLAKAMADKFQTLWVHEYGRELWQDQGLEGKFSDFLKIGLTQYGREQAAALHSRDFLFCDTNAWTTLEWSKLYYLEADVRLEALAESTKDEYLWVFCENDFGWINDGSRELEGDKSGKFHEILWDNLPIPYTNIGLARGSLEARIEEVTNFITKGVNNVYQST